MNDTPLTALDQRIATVRERLGRLPRYPLAMLPTPLEELRNLSRHVGGPRILLKRDDMTGLAVGGNKTRMLEFTLAKALNEGADAIIGTASVQSNYCRQMCAAGRKAGLDVHLVLRKIRGQRDEEIQGNYLLDVLMGAHVELIEPRDWSEHLAAVHAVRDRLRAAGKRPFIMRAANTEDTWLDAAGYANAMLEMVAQWRALDVWPSHLFLCSSDTTQAGMEVVAAYLGLELTIIGIRPSIIGSSPSGGTPVMAQIANRLAAELDLDLPAFDPDDLHLDPGYVGTGYGIPTPEGLAAIRLLAEQEAVFIDPVYSAKGFAGFLDYLRTGRIEPGEAVVFLHTGGVPSLFAYQRELLG